MKIFQQPVTLRERKRGFHLITNEITEGLPEIRNLKTGIC